MLLSPHEQERLMLSCAAELARRRRARGLELNLPEATAIVTDHVLEDARDGEPRAYVSTVAIGNALPGVGTAVDGVRLPLPGGWVGTAWAGELHEAVAPLASVARHPDLVEVGR